MIAIMKNRTIAGLIREGAGKPGSRILVLTGARQTGKTTLARHLFPGYQFLSIEDPVLRSSYASLTASQWKDLYPNAILDEVQKEPRLIESIKSVCDQWEEPRYVLSGSSQLLLLEKVRESLAGRCSIVDLYPLTVPELETESWDEPVRDSPFQSMLLYPEDIPGRVQSLLPDFRLEPKYARIIRAWNHYVRFGGYPALTNPDMDDEERYRWLANYVRTYLERDVRDLAVFRDLEPFVKLQRVIALQTASLVNHSAIGQQVGLSSKTVQRYIQYLELSYQVLVLPAWSGNERKRLAKSPKIHMLDYGVLQAIVQKRGSPTGLEFESMVIAELYKQAKAIRSEARFAYLRTLDGREVDLLVELAGGYLAFEIKTTERASATDARHLRDLGDMLDKPLLHSFVISNDFTTKALAPGVSAVHAGYMLG
jgi:hypothetical protein